ncbi:type II toxin-antitoxin system HipA family toxin [Pedobacter sp. Du54]|uniref:type II toxin-antitoxin system HipA family toxin n=1 Tax=Pedobacter anseongensis TaxID=3133439 RepID=UPI0030B0C387
MKTAYINIWNKRVGAVSWNDERKLGNFEFDPSFYTNNWDISPIKLPIALRGQIFNFPELVGSTTYKGLPGLLADVLPDRYGNTLINTWLARNGREPDSMHPVEMLCFTGNRGMGALEFEPVRPKSADNITKIEISSLIEVAQDILNKRSSFYTSLSENEEKALTDILKVGTSAGGARAKALIAYNEKTGEVRSGQATAPKGFEQWLIKFDGVHDTQFGESSGYGRVEMAYYHMAIACGIEMMESRLLEENDRAHFMTKRFDRIDGKEKLHVQTWCAMEHKDFQNVGDYSYEELFQTMRALGFPYPRAEQLFRRMVFNVMARNCDDHTKNFAFTMDKSGLWDLSPAYDICHAYRPSSIWVSRQSLSINGKREHFNRKDLLILAEQMNIKKPNQLIEEVQESVNNWKKHAKEADVGKKLTAAIQKTLLKL